MKCLCIYLFISFFSKDFQAPIPDPDKTIVIKVDAVSALMECTVQWGQLNDSTIVWSKVLCGQKKVRKLRNTDEGPLSETCVREESQVSSLMTMG